ncbi:hypothetical protein TNCV_5061701 [Trichonephila clavipes]|nr:hypothetical protein TNCV_5061701 [Trichonephila clavipes]
MAENRSKREGRIAKGRHRSSLWPQDINSSGVYLFYTRPCCNLATSIDLCLLILRRSDLTFRINSNRMKFVPLLMNPRYLTSVILDEYNSRQLKQTHAFFFPPEEAASDSSKAPKTVPLNCGRRKVILFGIR